MLLVVLIILVSLMYVQYKRDKPLTKPTMYIYTGSTFAKENNWKPTYQQVAVPKRPAKSAAEVIRNARKLNREEYIQSLKMRQG